MNLRKSKVGSVLRQRLKLLFPSSHETNQVWLGHFMIFFKLKIWLSKVTSIDLWSFCIKICKFWFEALRKFAIKKRRFSTLNGCIEETQLLKNIKSHRFFFIKSRKFPRLLRHGRVVAKCLNKGSVCSAQ